MLLTKRRLVLFTVKAFLLMTLAASCRPATCAAGARREGRGILMLFQLLSFRGPLPAEEALRAAALQWSLPEKHRETDGPAGKSRPLTSSEGLTWPSTGRSAASPGIPLCFICYICCYAVPSQDVLGRLRKKAPGTCQLRSGPLVMAVSFCRPNDHRAALPHFLL